MGNPSWYLRRGFLQSSGRFEPIGPPATPAYRTVRTRERDRTFLVAAQGCLHIVGDLPHLLDAVDEVSSVEISIWTRKGAADGRCLTGSEGHIRGNDGVERNEGRADRLSKRLVLIEAYLHSGEHVRAVVDK